jgi:predicted nucleotidyltransferase
MDYRLISIVNNQPYPLLFATLSGAHLYGFSSPDSDYDLRGVHILPIQEVIGLDIPQETLELSAIKDGLELDLVTHDIKKFFSLLLKRNGYVLEQLYSPLIIHTTPEHEELKVIAKDCITRHHVHHYLGFARTQWQLFAKENPPRVKPLLYVYRVLLTGIFLMETGQVEANLVNLNQRFNLTYIPDLIDCKLSGKEKSTLAANNLEFYHQEYERLLNKLEQAGQETHLPDHYSGKKQLNDLLLRVRLAN